MHDYILLWSVHINNLWVDIVYVILRMCALLCVLLYYDVIMHQHWRLFHMCVLVAAQWNPPGDHQCVSVWENNKYEEGGEMRGCDHQSIPLLLLKLRGRDRERETERRQDWGRWDHRAFQCGGGVGRGGDSKKKKDKNGARERHGYCSREWGKWGEWKTAKRWQESN